MNAYRPGNLESMIGQSPPMMEIKLYIRKLAKTDSTVLITGETGTGKELAAELIHRHSPRHNKAMVCINCTALPESLVESELFGYERGAFTGASGSMLGKFEMAENGTVFLDEIGDMNLFAQAKILRVIEKKEVYRLGGRKAIPLNIRVITATNQELEGLVSQGTFRKDLYYRINVARVHIPSLRDRKEDISCLLEHYIRELNAQFGRNVEGFTDEALEFLLRHDWPGNVRELKNLLEAVFIDLSAQKIALTDLPKVFRSRVEAVKDLPRSERDRILFRPLHDQLEQKQSRSEAPLVPDDSLPETGEAEHNQGPTVHRSKGDRRLVPIVTCTLGGYTGVTPECDIAIVTASPILQATSPPAWLLNAFPIPPSANRLP